MASIGSRATGDGREAASKGSCAAVDGHALTSMGYRATGDGSAVASIGSRAAAAGCVCIWQQALRPSVVSARANGAYGRRRACCCGWFVVQLKLYARLQTRPSKCIIGIFR